MRDKQKGCHPNLDEARSKYPTLYIAIVVFLCSSSVYLLVGPDAPQGGDTVPNRYLAYTVWCGDLTLDRLYPLWTRPGTPPSPPPYYATRSEAGPLISTFGPAVPLLSAPFFLVADLISPIQDSSDILHVSRLLSGILSGLSVTFVFLACLKVARLWPSLLATFLFAFGSGNFSVTSRGLWQHTWATPLIASGLYFCLRSLRDRCDWSAGLAGLLFSLATTCRPQTFLFLVACAFAVAKGRKTIALYALFAFPAIAALLAYNTWSMGSPFAFAQTIRSLDVAEYKTSVRSLMSSSPLIGLLGLLISPSRGLFVFSPAFFPSIFGGYLAMREKGLRPLRPFIFATVGLWLVAGLWFDWWGGYTLSCRPILEGLPTITVLCAIGLESLQGRLLRGLWFISAAWSVLLALSAVTHPGAVMWNDEVQVDRHPERLWSVTDSLPLRLLEMRREDRLPLMDSFPVRFEDCTVRHVL